jgi:hypothetical protein
MKNKLFLAGMLAMALTFGLVLTGCPTDADDDGGGGGSLPSANAVGTWVPDGGDSITLKINADGTGEYDGGEYSKYPATVTADTLKFKSDSGHDAGSAKYTVTGTTLTLSDATVGKNYTGGLKIDTILDWTKQ